VSKPVLYSFRRCPYAIRARLAIHYAGLTTEHREILLRDKAEEFLQVSQSKTVPTLVLDDRVLDESYDIMLWALDKNDPENWLEIPTAGIDLIAQADGPFKDALDRTKYASRYPQEEMIINRQTAADFLITLDRMLVEGFLFGPNPSLADMAILPFVRQFAFIDKFWFDAQPWPSLQRWLEDFLASDLFAAVMPKYPRWQTGDVISDFPPIKTD
jgi:glutathione S-transferase